MTSNNTEREKLREQIDALYEFGPSGFQIHPNNIVAFILADRQRIVEPLVNIPEQVLSYVDAPVIQALAISKTLRRAGVK